MNYPNGGELKTGHIIWCNEGVNIGVVSALIETSDQWKRTGVEESGIFVCLDLSGKSLTDDLFIAEEQFADEGIERLATDEVEEIKRRFAQLCKIEKEAAGKSFGVLRHKVRVGLPWIFDIGGRNGDARAYFAFTDSDKIVRLSREQVLG